MIARIWRGAVRAEDTEAYARYVKETGIDGYEKTPGNRGAWVLWQTEGDRTEIVTLSFWDSMDAIVGFAGQDLERAVFYPEDDRFLVERDLTVRHYEVGPHATKQRDASAAIGVLPRVSAPWLPGIPGHAGRARYTNPG